MKTRKTVPAKTKALLQQEINSICPFCNAIHVDHFHIHHIDEDPTRNEFVNLIMVCPTCHSKITKKDISGDEVVRKKNFLLARGKSGIRNKSIFSAREDRDFEYLREKLDRLIRVLCSTSSADSKMSAKDGYWEVSVSALELLLMCYSEDPSSIGMYDSWEKDRGAVIEMDDGLEISITIAASSDFYDPIPVLIQCDLLKTKRDWNGRYEFTKKMHTFVHWTEYHQIKPRSFEYEYKTIGEK